MSEDRSRISLRSGPKRKGRPTISAPRQISSPIPQGEVPARGPSIPRAAAPDVTPPPRARPLPVSEKASEYSS